MRKNNNNVKDNREKRVNATSMKQNKTKKNVETQTR